MLKITGLLIVLVFLTPRIILANPPTDPAALKLYNHDKEWLSHFPASFIAQNIRGQGTENLQRRQAALDLLREHSERGTAPELVYNLQQGSVLSAEICDLLGDWGDHAALPVLQQVAKDHKRPKPVREAAKAAVAKILDGTIKP